MVKPLIGIGRNIERVTGPRRLMRYRPEIDGLRSLAVVSVILFHAGFRLFGGGFVGVDIFFVISGYLITMILLGEIREGRFSLLRFYERRARRILPALFIVVCACIPFAWEMLPPKDMRNFSQSIVSVVGYVSNIFFWETSDYFATTSELKPLLHTWSLSVEEQYYLIFPLILAFVLRKKAGRLGWGLLGISFLSLVLSQWVVTEKPEFAFYMLPTRAWELLIGSLAAYWVFSRQEHIAEQWLAEAGCWLGVSMIAYATFKFTKSTPFPGVYALAPTVGAVLIILCASQKTVVGRLLASRPLVGIGLLSYSAYLWHQPLFAFARIYMIEAPSGKLMFGLVVLTILLAYLTWRFVEKPFRDRQSVSGKNFLIACVLMSLLLASFGLIGSMTNGYRALRFDQKFVEVLRTAQENPYVKKCHADGGNYIEPSNACEYQKGQLSWAVFGDSHAVELAYSLSEKIKNSGQKLKHFSYSSCRPSFDSQVEIDPRSCAGWTKDALRYIAENNEIKNVVVSYRINAALFGGHENIYPGIPDTVNQSEREASWRSYLAILGYLVAHHKQVYLVLQAPELPAEMEYLIFKSKDPTGVINGVPATWWKQRTAFLRSHINELPVGVKVIDPATLLCNDSQCIAARNGMAYYIDDDHLSINGMALVADQILK